MNIHTNFKDDLIEHKCLSGNKIYQQKFNEKLKERFYNTCKFSNHDNSHLNMKELTDADIMCV